MYSKIMRLRRINTAGTAIYEGQQLLMTHGIFIPSELSNQFGGAFEVLGKAHGEQYVNFEHGGGAGHQNAMFVVGAGGEQVLLNLQMKVRANLRRD